MVSLKSSLILFLTVITALTLNFTGFSVDTEEEDEDDEGEEEEPFIKSSLIAATGNFAALFILTTLLFSKGTKNRVELKNDEGEEEEGTNMDLSSNEEPKICFVRAILLFCSKKSSPSLSFVLCVCVCVFSL